VFVDDAVESDAERYTETLTTSTRINIVKHSNCDTEWTCPATYSTTTVMTVMCLLCVMEVNVW